MLALMKTNKIFMASEPVDFRLSIDGLSQLIERNNSELHDGSIYVFYNKNKDKIKCLFWDSNGLVLYYKRLENLKFKIQMDEEGIHSITATQLQRILSGKTITESKKLPNPKTRGL